MFLYRNKNNLNENNPNKDNLNRSNRNFCKNHKWHCSLIKVCRRFILGVVCTFYITGCSGSDRVLMIPETEEAVLMRAETGNADEAAGETADRSDMEAKIMVYVCGAVKQPGVVELPAKSRVVDALEAAGGFAGDADVQTVNLAALIMDGQKLYFPALGDERGKEIAAGAQAGENSGESEGNEAGLVNINTADAALLCTLPGVGTSKAQAIIAYREAKGAFARPEDVMKVAGIKESVYSKISDKICVR